MILDFHTHTFPDALSAKIITGLAQSGHIQHYTNASRPELLASMKKAGIDWAVNMPVHTRPDQVEKINRDLVDVHEAMVNKHLLTFGGMHPEYTNTRNELRWLKEHGISGIKLHPAFQKKDLDAPEMMKIIAEASELDMIVLVHAGMDVSYPQRNFSSVPMILHVIDTIHPSKLIVAHMGGWDCWDDVEKYLAGSPVWFDTAFSLGPIEPFDPAQPAYRTWQLTDEDFVRLARKHGTDRILFGTDSPWADQAAYVQHFCSLPWTEEEKVNMLWQNGAALLHLPDSIIDKQETVR